MASPRYPPTSPEMRWLIDLHKALTVVSMEELGVVTDSALKGAQETLSKRPVQARQDALERVEHMLGGLMVVYVFGVEESTGDDHGLSRAQRYRLWNEGLEPADHEELLALRHIRHSVAHGFRGARARQHRAEFDRATQAGRLGRIVWRSDQNTLMLERLAGYEAGSRMRSLSQSALAALVKVNQ